MKNKKEKQNKINKMLLFLYIFITIKNIKKNIWKKQCYVNTKILL